MATLAIDSCPAPVCIADDQQGWLYAQHTSCVESYLVRGAGTIQCVSHLPRPWRQDRGPSLRSASWPEPNSRVRSLRWYRRLMWDSKSGYDAVCLPEAPAGCGKGGRYRVTACSERWCKAADAAMPHSMTIATLHAAPTCLAIHLRGPTTWASQPMMKRRAGQSGAQSGPRKVVAACHLFARAWIANRLGHVPDLRVFEVKLWPQRVDHCTERGVKVKVMRK